MRQRGVALLTALLVVALAVLIATAMLSRQQLAIRRTANLLNHEQAFLYALGAESWARRILLRDAQHSSSDHLRETWALQMPPTTVPGGSLGGYLEDMQGRFNLNTLIDAEGKVVESRLRQFQRLLELLDLPPALAQQLIDWLDPDTAAQIPGGAEDQDYLSLNPPYRTANSRLHSPSELRLLLEMDAASYRRLQAVVTALPTPTPVNINTASALVLRSLFDNLSQQAAETLVEKAKQQGFTDVNSFLKEEALAGLVLDQNTLSVRSEYFMLHAEALIGRNRVRLNSLIHRSNQQTQVLLRSRGES